MNADVSLLLRLLTAHVLTDFVFQTVSMVNDRFERRWRSPWLYAHAAIAGLLTYVLSGYWFSPRLPVAIFTTHLIIDGVRVWFKNSNTSLFLDQLSHVVVIVICWWVMQSRSMWFTAAFFSTLFTKQRTWIVLLAYLIAIWPTGIFIERFTATWWSVLNKESERGLERAGMWIGRLERILILTFVLLDRFDAIGFLIAAKSILRFGDTSGADSRKESEYILIGTMMSFAIAIGIGLLAKRFLE